MTLNPTSIPELLRQAGIRPRKSLGQNFLIEPAGLEKVVQAAAILPGEEILEIGAGLGNLTALLCQTGNRVVAVELDSRLIRLLQDHLGGAPNLTIIQGDILRQDLSNLDLASGYLVVANIPYYITSAIIRHLLESASKPARLVLTVQQEVAQRIISEPGDLSLLALSVQVFGLPRIVARIPAGCFYPPPEVDSAVLRVDLHREPVIPSNLLDDFFLIIKSAFNQKRKTLRNALSSGLHLPVNETAAWLQAAGIDPMRRAETVSLPEWSHLVSDHSRMIPRRKS